MSLKKEDIYNGITDIDGELIEEAAAAKRARIAKIIRFAGNAAAVIVIGIIIVNGGFFSNFGKMGSAPDTASIALSTEAMEEESVMEQETGSSSDELLNSKKTATVSESALASGIDKNLLMASPLLRDDSGVTNSVADIVIDKPAADTKVNGFTGRLIRNFFMEGNDENRIVNPMNVYFALAILTETTDGNSRKELLNALGAKNIDSLRKNALALWDYNYRNDGEVTSLLGSSIWLSDRYGYNTDTLRTLADYYYTESYSGEMGSDSLNESLHKWINLRTGDFLKDQVGALKLSKDMVTAIVTTAYFKDAWVDIFNKNANTEEIFKGTKGDKETTFMHNSGRNVIYSGKDYTALALKMNRGYDMLFIKPEEGKTVYDLIKKDNVLKFILSDSEAEKRKVYTVDYSIPKFDVESTVELMDILTAMGVNDVFTGEADFTGLTTDTDKLEISDILHGARVKVDEEGAEAAAYTVITLGETALPMDDFMEFVLDRPFIYVIRNDMGAPLFVGVINNIE